eukprot:SM000406S15600  [mRNA]  locus=s406:33423:37590:- [translate_table: standard]
MAQKQQKYDRQLRIWGEHGQRALESARVCLLNCGPTGSEVLKNLVLGGIGSFTVVDGAQVEEADLGNNYLVDMSNLHQSRAKCVSALLQELNESVEAKFVEEYPEALIESNPSFFADFSLVIATQIGESSLVKLDAICRADGVCLLVARCYGLAGLIRISSQEHRVIEAKPDNVVDDLRLHAPWPELKQYAATYDLDTSDSLIHKHIPYAVLLLRIAEDWRATHIGSLPSTSQERSAFKASISARMRSDDEDNYKEALAAAYRIWSPPSSVSDVEAVVSDKATDVNACSADFWILVAALKEFMMHDGKGQLPLNGGIPDMHSLSEYYIGLQQIYQSKAEADVTKVEGYVHAILNKVGRDPKSISRTSVKMFCRNCSNIKVLRWKTLAEEYNNRNGQELQRLLAVEDSNNAALYVLLRAAEQFAATYNRYPGVFDGIDEEEDVSRLKAVAMGLLTELGASSSTLPEDLISEICRFGASELHCPAAVIGGIASQEAIKLITGQFVPILGTLIYNGIACTTSVLAL